MIATFVRVVFTFFSIGCGLQGPSDVEEHGLVLALQADIKAIDDLAVLPYGLGEERLPTHVEFDQVQY